MPAQVASITSTAPAGSHSPPSAAVAVAKTAAATRAVKRRKKSKAVIPWYLLDATGTFKVSWDMWALVILMYTVVIAPLRLGFDMTDYCPNSIWVSHHA